MGDIYVISQVNNLLDIPVRDGNIAMDPMFVDPMGDWHLTGASPAEVKQGGKTFPMVSMDKEGTPRTTGTWHNPINLGAEGWSMGAYEFDL